MAPLIAAVYLAAPLGSVALRFTPQIMRGANALSNAARSVGSQIGSQAANVSKLTREFSTGVSNLVSSSLSKNANLPNSISNTVASFEGKINTALSAKEAMGRVITEELGILNVTEALPNLKTSGQELANLTLYSGPTKP